MSILPKTPTPIVRLPSALAGIRGLKPERIPIEILAGLTLAALMIPLNIGYAQVAGLPPVVGLYAAIVPSIAFALLAHSRHVVSGPDAAIGAMLAGMLGAIVAPGDPRYLDLVLTTTLLCGVIFSAFWLFRLGFLANLLSYAVLVGFITGLGRIVSSRPTGRSWPPSRPTPPRADQGSRPTRDRTTAGAVLRSTAVASTASRRVASRSRAG